MDANVLWEPCSGPVLATVVHPVDLYLGRATLGRYSLEKYPNRNICIGFANKWGFRKDHNLRGFALNSLLFELLGSLLRS